MASKIFRTLKVFFDNFWLSMFFSTFWFSTFWSSWWLLSLLTFWSTSIFVTFDVLINFKNTFDILINQSTFRLSMFFFRLSTKWFSTFWPFPFLNTKYYDCWVLAVLKHADIFDVSKNLSEFLVLPNSVLTTLAFSPFCTFFIVFCLPSFCVLK